MAKPPTVGAKALTAALLAKLKWDDAKLLAAPKASAYPLQLRDGDLLLVRDAGDADAHAEAAADAAAKTKSPTGRGGRGRGRGRAGRGGASGDVTVVAAAARPEHALKIHTCFDDAAGGGSASGA